RSTLFPYTTLFRSANAFASSRLPIGFCLQPREPGDDARILSEIDIQAPLRKLERRGNGEIDDAEFAEHEFLAVELFVEHGQIALQLIARFLDDARIVAGLAEE